MAKFMLIEGCDFESLPVGGQLSFAKDMIKVFGDNLVLVGFSIEKSIVGKWTKKKIHDIDIDFFSIGTITNRKPKPFIPARIVVYIKLILYKNKIMSFGVENLFTQAPEVLFAVSKWGFSSICYMFPGIENPLSMSRYGFANIFAKYWDTKLFKSLTDVDVVLACADDSAINELIKRSRGRLLGKKVVKFPTRVDTNVFFPSNKGIARTKLGLSGDVKIFVCNGRINSVKGWGLIIESFFLFLQKNYNSIMVFVGDGEDRDKLEERIFNYGIGKNIIITGFLDKYSVADYLNASDAVLIGSYKEGWSIAMLEAIACGKPLVTTKVSGAHDMVVNGVNGFIVESRDIDRYANAMNNVLALEDYREVSKLIATKYSIESLRTDFGRYWHAIS